MIAFTSATVCVLFTDTVNTCPSAWRHATMMDCGGVIQTSNAHTANFVSHLQRACYTPVHAMPSCQPVHNCAHGCTAMVGSQPITPSTRSLSVGDRIMKGEGGKTRSQETAATPLSSKSSNDAQVMEGGLPSSMGSGCCGVFHMRRCPWETSLGLLTTMVKNDFDFPSAANPIWVNLGPPPTARVL
jgi:hypothetical protein